MTISIRSMRLSLTSALICGAVFTTGLTTFAQTSMQQPDNSAQNKHQGTTADNQVDAKADRMTAANVRKAIVADKDLSMYAHNVKVITMNGTVTLKGPVKSDDEKQKVAMDAASVVAQDKIVNQLTVKQ